MGDIMFDKFANYIKDDRFNITLTNDMINVNNYLEINYMEEDKISLRYKKGTLLIIGKKLVVKKLLDNEILITGDILELDFK